MAGESSGSKQMTKRPTEMAVPVTACCLNQISTFLCSHNGARALQASATHHQDLSYGPRSSMAFNTRSCPRSSTAGPNVPLHCACLAIATPRAACRNFFPLHPGCCATNIVFPSSVPAPERARTFWQNFKDSFGWVTVKGTNYWSWAASTATGSGHLGKKN